MIRSSRQHWLKDGRLESLPLGTSESPEQAGTTRTSDSAACHTISTAAEQGAKVDDPCARSDRRKPRLSTNVSFSPTGHYATGTH